MNQTSWIADIITQQGFGVGLIAVFFAGLALNLTPCVYPMIPVTLAFFSAQAEGKTRYTVQLALCYVLGISLSYAGLGFLASRTGALLGSWLQQPAVLIGIACVIVALSFSLFGFYELRPPRFLTNRLGAAGAGAPGALIMGLVVGVVAAPCVGPVLLSLFLLASRIDRPEVGFLLFFVLGLGMGLPYLVLALLTTRVSRLPKAGVWLVWSKKVLGCVLLGMAVYFVRPLIPDGALRPISALLAIAAGLYLGWLERSRAPGHAFTAVRFLLGSALVVAGGVALVPSKPAAQSLQWMPYTERAFTAALDSGRPIVIDLYADWCIPCVELDHTTFRHPDVIRALAPIATLRVDATRELSQDAQALADAHELVGVPTVLFFDRAGNERADLRLTGFEPPEKFLKRLERLRAQ